MDSYIKAFIGKIHFHRHRVFYGSKRKVMTYEKCLKNFIIYRGIGFARGKINLGTLDVLELQGSLRGKEEAVNRKLIDKKIATINERNEFRSFFFFLKKEFPESYHRIPFVKSERPDFILRYNNQILGIEITEAIDGEDAKQRAKVYESDLRGRKPGAIEQYVDSIPNPPLDKSKIPIERLIDKRVKDKREKFEEFQRVDREILVILANHDEFQDSRDEEKVRRFLERKGSLEKAPFTLVVLNLTRGLYVHYRWDKGKVVPNKSVGSRKKASRPMERKLEKNQGKNKRE